MNLLQRITLLLTSPDYATSEAYRTPNITQGFLIVTVYAVCASFNSFLSAAIKSESVALSFITFISTFFITYFVWIVLTIVLHLAAELWGGLGELPIALAFVGLAAAPMAVTSLASILLTVFGFLLTEDDPDLVFAKIGLVVSLIGMAWGWPGLLCYFGLKNGERLHAAKAATITLIAFIGLALYEIMNSNAF